MNERRYSAPSGIPALTGLISLVLIDDARLITLLQNKILCERKAAMVSNLLIELCGERCTHPIVNTGTLC